MGRYGHGHCGKGGSATKHSLVSALGSGTSPRSQPQASRKQANSTRNNKDRGGWTARQNTVANRTHDITPSNRRTICRSRDPALTHTRTRRRSIMPEGVGHKSQWERTSDQRRMLRLLALAGSVTGLAACWAAEGTAQDVENLCRLPSKTWNSGGSCLGWH